MPAEDIVLGRGMVFFDRFADGTTVGEGERYIGNTMGFAIRREVSEIERLRSIRGVLSKQDSLVIRELLQGTFVTDAISVENAAMWFGADALDNGLPPGDFVTETFTIKKGRYYQLGMTVSGWGVLHAETVTFKLNGTDFNISGELTLDKVNGRIFVLPSAPTIEDGDILAVQFERRSSPESQEWTSVAKPVEGSLRFISTNPVGPAKNYFFPHIVLAPSGEASLKGDEWQQLGFTFEAKRPAPRYSQMFGVHIGAPSLTFDELAIIEHGGIPLDLFPFYDDELHEIINVRIPAHDY